MVGWYFWVTADISKSSFSKLTVEEARLWRTEELMGSKVKIVEGSFFRKCNHISTDSYFVYLHEKQSV